MAHALISDDQNNVTALIDWLDGRVGLDGKRRVILARTLLCRKEPRIKPVALEQLLKSLGGQVDAEAVREELVEAGLLELATRRNGPDYYILHVEEAGIEPVPAAASVRGAARAAARASAMAGSGSAGGCTAVEAGAATEADLAAGAGPAPFGSAGRAAGEGAGAPPADWADAVAVPAAGMDAASVPASVAGAGIAVNVRVEATASAHPGVPAASSPAPAPHESPLEAQAGEGDAPAGSGASHDGVERGAGHALPKNAEGDEGAPCGTGDPVAAPEGGCPAHEEPDDAESPAHETSKRRSRRRRRSGSEAPAGNPGGGDHNPNGDKTPAASPQAEASAAQTVRGGSGTEDGPRSGDGRKAGGRPRPEGKTRSEEGPRKNKRSRREGRGAEQGPASKAQPASGSSRKSAEPATGPVRESRLQASRRALTGLFGAVRERAVAVKDALVPGGEPAASGAPARSDAKAAGRKGSDDRSRRRDAERPGERRSGGAPKPDSRPDDLKLVQRWLEEQGDERPAYATRRQRAYQIFGDEKALEGKRGEKLMRRMTGKGLNPASLRIEANQTTQLQGFFTIGSDRPFIVMENIDAYEEVVNLLKGKRSARLFGARVGGVIFGAGHNICMSHALDEYLHDIGYRFPYVYYAGDIDREGARLVERAREVNVTEIRLHVGIYRAMLAAHRAHLKQGIAREDAAKNQDAPRDLSGVVKDLPVSLRVPFQRALRDNIRVPQEVLTSEDFRRASMGAVDRMLYR